MTRRAIIIGLFAAIGLLAFVFLNGFFMGAREVECLPYAECEPATKAAD